MDYVKDIIPESSEQPSRLTQSRKKTWRKSWGRPERNVIFGHGTSRKCAQGEQRGLRGLFRNQGVLGFSCLRSHDPHFVPVVAEFFSAVQARDIGARALRRWVATRTGAHRNRETVASVPAAKHGVEPLQKHRVTSTEQKRQQWLIPSPEY